ncbi:MAG: hypothetical protein CVU84_02355 [Firmicutes bacterium HGW-Firmicutes-1]|jgi:hypothetical protein|nr:MAG: hypothetical protein CVU84_02355 [Firmicutes bacterium HGW-Firmicutes-1]
MPYKTDNKQKKSTSSEIDAQLVRYSGIISAIEFFSQRFELDQLMTYAFEFCNDLLLPNQMVLYFKNESSYSIFKSMGYDETFSFEYNDHYNQIVYFHAGLIYEKQILSLLPKEINDLFKPDFCIPLIMDKSFFGLIAVKRSESKPFDSADEEVASALMNLYSTAFTNYSSYKALETTKIQLDEKIFNLFAMNHSTKALLSELSLPSLCELAIGVFSELTQSNNTTFFIKDPISENYKLMSYKNVLIYNQKLEITLFPNSNHVASLPVLIDMNDKKSTDLFINNFFNGEDIISKINPEYIVLLKKSSQLVGFVTLGAKVNDTVYDNSIFELVESLASATYIAINNVFYIEVIERQKKLVSNKLNDLLNLNMLMKNMNSAQTHDQVISLVMNTLNVSFGIEMGFFALFDYKKQAFTISNKINIRDTDEQIQMRFSFLPLFDGEPILVYEEDKIVDFLPDAIIDAFIKPGAGLVMIPVYIKGVDIQLIGFFALLRSRTKIFITEESLVSFDAIATHIAPVIHQLQYAERIKQTYQPDYSYMFLDHLQLQLDEAVDFSLNLYIVHIYHAKAVHFTQSVMSKTLQGAFKNVYNIDKRNTFILTNNPDDLLKIEELVNADQTYQLKSYMLGTDFDDFSSFLAIFES